MTQSVCVCVCVCVGGGGEGDGGELKTLFHSNSLNTDNFQGGGGLKFPAQLFPLGRPCKTVRTTMILFITQLQNRVDETKITRD